MSYLTFEHTGLLCLIRLNGEALKPVTSS